MMEDWVECKLGDLLKLKNGFAFKSKSYLPQGIPVIRIGDIKNWSIDIEGAKKIDESEEYEAYKIKKGDILIAMSGATTGKFGIYQMEEKAYQNQRVGNLIPHNDSLVLRKFIFYLLYSLKRDIERKAYGGAQPNISATKIHELDTKLFPLPIQRAIVARIEELFSSLDQGVADLQRAQEQLRVYRQAVLKKAFEGGYSGKKFEFQRIDTICEVVRGGSPRPAGSPKYYNGSIPFLKVKDISRNDGVYISSAEYSIKEAGLKKTRLVPENTLLLTNSGATLGIPGITTFATTFNDGIAAFLNLDDNLLYHYYFWSYQTPFLRNLNQGAAQPNLNTRVIGSVEIPIYHDKSEHEKIVKEIESRLSICDQVEANIQESLAKAEALRQSILKKAFEGDLLTAAEIAACKEEADYEPAAVLLARMKAEQKK